ncbi:class I lanthipeptide [Haliangium sp.]|uniref:class I lanthipeptide n=1 Tax=Haliangium sp. TaxID=2663208 RepID=UPI003D1100C7
MNSDKNKLKKRLKLSRSTIRRLSTAHMEAANGGGETDTCTCTTTLVCPPGENPNTNPGYTDACTTG